MWSCSSNQIFMKPRKQFTFQLMVAFIAFGVPHHHLPSLTFPSLATPPSNSERTEIPNISSYKTRGSVSLLLLSLLLLLYHYFLFFFVSSSSSGSGRSFCNLPVCFSVDGWNGWNVVPRSAAVGLVAVEKKAKREKQSSRNYYVVGLSFTLPTVPCLPAQV